jgi:tetrathionate reductase subunit B
MSNPSNQAPIENRRDFLKKASAALVILPANETGAEATQPANAQKSDLFQPEAFWTDRITAPEDGNRLGWFVDTRRCFGCHGCEVSCKSENDVPLGNYIRQTIYQDVGEYPKVARLFLPMSCQHCEDALCLKACPCGAIHKQSGGMVAVDYNLCCGHGTCVKACPYGAIYLDPVAKQAVKCHNCYHRTDEGLEPACLPTCPAEALHYEPPSAWPETMMDHLGIELFLMGQATSHLSTGTTAGTDAQRWSAADVFGPAPNGEQVLEHAKHVLGSQRTYHFQRQAFVSVLIDHHQQP